MMQRTGAAGTIRRVATTATAVLAATTFLAGCGGTRGTDGGSDPAPAAPAAPAAASSAAADPKAVLLAAVPNEQDPAFRFSGVDGTDKITGMVDPAGKAMELSYAQKFEEDTSVSMKLSFRMIEERSWMRVRVSGIDGLQQMMKIPTRWMALDKSKIKEDPPVYEGTDPGNAAVIIGTADTVTDKGDGTYTGFADLTRGTEVADAISSVDVAALGAAAKKVPFTAVVGADGNLASLTVELPAAGKKKAGRYVVKYFDFGKAPKVAAPSGSEAQPAPEEAYELLNS
ncbi:hypothetical protein [Micromonospora auratinigra]|uniref:Lipoprotein n=1 Tax=Micromonospora auratinigra TaxID=261654 RepID=A0A1A8ZVD6_9ACTN|nr:hypothetical protein [Micromonospora auratinigra]SBT48083.1 hypothetical protein GA0070611_3946 [Micromonospora auratinigra]